MGCIARLGCLIVLAILAVAAWLTRGVWLPDHFKSESVAEGTWQPVSDAGATRARTAIDKLGQPRGPVFQTLSAGDVASLAFSELSRRATGAVDSVAAKVEGERITMRASVRLAGLGGQLGPVAGVLRERETVELSGNFLVLRPGVAGFVVQRAQVGAVTLPQGMIPRLVQEIDRSGRAQGLPENALRLPLPSYVGDIRVANGKVNLYKNVK